MSDERDVVLTFLKQARRHVLGAVDGLCEEDMRRPILPSGWTCVGLINHLAVDVELFWFRAVMANDAKAWASLNAATTSAWTVGAEVDVQEVLAGYEREIALADEVISSTAMDAAPEGWPEGMFGSFRLDNLRELMLHVISETACHAGHLDAARELVDGHQWMVL